MFSKIIEGFEQKIRKQIDFKRPSNQTNEQRAKYSNLNVKIQNF